MAYCMTMSGLGAVSVTDALVTGGISAGISIATQMLIGPINKLIKGCGESCVLTSNWANQAEGLLKKNVQEYQALPAPRAKSVQRAFLANFDTIWNFLYQQCNNPQLGNAGRNCIADRQAGACKWKESGQCWNWFVGYRDPIANDANVVDDPPATFGLPPDLQSFTSGVTSGDPQSLILLALAGLVLAAVIL